MEVDKKIRLMDLSHGAGCGCKLGPADLHPILQKIGVPQKSSHILVGFDTGDDASVIQIREDLALVLTLDFFTPILNEPYRFGQVAAANALSDIYAMGGTPISALSIVAFPLARLGTEILGEILQGGMDKTREAGIEITGGHSIDDAEPKFGLSVTGTIHPKEIFKNRGAKLGDVLILTKPLGSGIITTAIKRGLASKDQEEEAFRTMAMLNKQASEVFCRNRESVHAMTDVTGFSLLGHLWGMLKESRLSAEIEVGKVPLMQGLNELLSQKCWPGGTDRNYRYIEDIADFSKLPSNDRDLFKYLLCDPQTSGGLLTAVHPDGLEKILKDLKAADCTAATVIGRIVAMDDGAESIVLH